MSESHVIERTWDAPMALIWELWTSAEGLESWWGPNGFTVEVHELDVRPGGSFRYTMRATGPEMIERMTTHGRPLSHSVTSTFSEVDAPRKLAWSAPFGPETLSTTVVFSQAPVGVKMVLTLQSTKAGTTAGPAMGWKSSLERFAQRLAR
ncbi:MAG: hypothetical protein ACI9MC_000734 [Kiritimatiellia bacterium]|jgi:uncharacterized protein YndB with AHSA1/START domain